MNRRRRHNISAIVADVDAISERINLRCKCGVVDEYLVHPARTCDGDKCLRFYVIIVQIDPRLCTVLFDDVNVDDDDDYDYLDDGKDDDGNVHDGSVGGNGKARQ